MERSMRQSRKSAARQKSLGNSEASEQKVGRKPKLVSVSVGTAKWKPLLDSYQQLRSLQFPSQDRFEAAAEVLWNGELRDLPYDLVGNRTIIVPAEAVP